MYKWFHSRLRCRACDTKGHLSDDCKNPIAQRCPKCDRKGHNSIECRANANPTGGYFKLPSPQVSRFVWDRAYAKAQSQVAQLEYEDAKEAAAAKGTSLTFAEDHEYKRKIWDAKHVFGQNVAANSGGFNGAYIHHNLNDKPAHAPVNNAGPNVVTRSKSIAAAARNSIGAGNRHVVELLQKEGVESGLIKQFEQLVEQNKRDAKTDLEKQIEDKIAFALCYPLKCVNNLLTLGELEICSRKVLPQWRMDEVKNAMRQGSKIFRDPRAIAALFARQVPCCNKCLTPGMIVDRYFCQVPANSTKQTILALHDEENWGIFVGFPCHCANEKTSFSYVPCPWPDLAGLPEEER